MEEPILQAIEHFNLKVAAVERVAQSYSSIVRILVLENGEKRVLKIPFAKSKLLRELRILNVLQGMVPVPRLVDHWLRDDDIPGALLLSFLPGEPLTGPIPPEVSFKLGELLAHLHSNHLERFGDEFSVPAANSHDWWSVIDSYFQTWIPICSTILPVDLLEKVLKEYNRLYANLPEPDGPCVVHFDYRPGNILVRDNQVSGLIDFESSRGGSADLDFTKIKTEVWDAFTGTKEHFLHGYASVRPLPNIEATLPFYELYNAFGGIAWCSRRAKLDDPFFYFNLDMLKRLTTR